jgi:hypothetical protein
MFPSALKIHLKSVFTKVVEIYAFGCQGAFRTLYQWFCLFANLMSAGAYDVEESPSNIMAYFMGRLSVYFNSEMSDTVICTSKVLISGKKCHIEMAFHN